MLRIHRFALPLSMTLITLTGCSTTLMSAHSPDISPREGQQALEHSADCCSSLADLPYQSLSARQSLTLTFTPETPVHDFADGKSFFHAFELPRGSGPLSLSVTSPIRKEQLFAPSILILDEAFQPVQRLSSSELHVQRPSGFSGARLSGDFTVLPGSQAAYIVIYTSQQDRRATTAYESEEKAYARVRGLAAPTGPDPVAEHAVTGEIDLEVTPLAQGNSVVSMFGTSPSSTGSSSTVQSRPASVPSSQPTPAKTGDFDYRRMIDAALKAGDIELALELAERAEQAGHQGTRAWLADRLEAAP